ncbi:MAG: cupin [Rhodospirillales bacterium]|nr:cupin [Rhodospirillales bacterium]
MPIKASVQHSDPALFRTRGLRDYFTYRDLGTAEVSNGGIVAQINKVSRALTEEGELHHHVVTNQWNLVLKGSPVMRFEGTGIVQLDEGCAFHMPPNIKHTRVSCTDDFETLEICTPADFGT